MPPKQFHSLTEDIWYEARSKFTKQAVDIAVRKWLSEKQDELSKAAAKAYYAKEILVWRDIHSILSLTTTIPGKEDEKKCANWNHTKGMSNDCVVGECFKEGELLGLEPKGEEPEMMGGYPIDKSWEKPEPRTQESEKPEWCDEIILMPYGYYYKGSSLGCHVPDTWKQCPDCLKPRPSKPTNREELARKLADIWSDKHSFQATNEEWLEMADAALSFLGDKGE